ncbi:MAG: hypothetical protein FJ098_08660 [Deltaproteobacteria bacterium]|nr:hypothetical protein [Deltaproteobacteria bacterium]
MRRTTIGWMIPVLAAAVAAGCNPVYAPPVWSTHYGAAGRPLDGRMQAGFAGTHCLTGGPWWTFHVVRGLQLEAGTDSVFFPDGDGWVLGRLGARYTFSWRRNDPEGAPGRGWAMDLEAGGGLGAGGENGDESDESGCRDCGRPWKRLAGGLYAGIGGAYHVVRWFSVFARARQQFSKAEEVPWTLWTSALAGPEFSVGPFSIYLAGGYAQYWNPKDLERGFLAEGGFAFRFGYRDDRENPGSAYNL